MLLSALVTAATALGMDVPVFTQVEPLLITILVLHGEITNWKYFFQMQPVTPSIITWPMYGVIWTYSSLPNRVYLWRFFPLPPLALERFSRQRSSSILVTVLDWVGPQHMMEHNFRMSQNRMLIYKVSWLFSTPS